jgi:predicted NUDIX family phosphoesterase/dephospho-CoA kinase
MSPPPLRSEFLEIAYQVLSSQKVALTPRQIVSNAMDNGMFSDRLAGKTPHQTMKSKLSVHIRSKGSDSPFVRTAPGRFFLRHLLDESSAEYQAPPLRAPVSRERVIVFPADLTKDSKGFQGITTSWLPWHRTVLSDGRVQAVNRQRAEQTDDYKQILTYIMVTRKGDLLTFRRGTYSRVEDWLRGSRCVGFGGHLSDEDRTLFSSSDQGLSHSALRELSEELRLPLSDRDRLEVGEGLELVGCLNDDSSAVGRRHFAFVMRYEVSDNAAWDAPARGEKSITQVKWLDPATVGSELWQYEYWSQLCLRTFYGPEVRAAPWYRVLHPSRLRPPAILCVAGQIGSGKSEATEVLVRDHRYVEVNSGRVLAGLLGLRSVTERTRPKFQEAANRFISRPDGAARLAKAIWRDVKASKRDRVVIDGLRQHATLEALAQLAHPRKIAIIFVHAPPDVAWKFYQKRAGSSAKLNDFLRVRDAPVETDTASLITRADAVLYNWTGRRQYRAAIGALMKEVGS